MARYIGQIQDEFNPYYELTTQMGNGKNTVVKIGIQLEDRYMVKINGVSIAMGKTGKLEYEDVAITSLMLFHANDPDHLNTNKIPVIIDYICEKEMR